MNPSAIRNLIRQGEDSSRQFKEDVTNADSLAAEMVAMSNGTGGMILIGVGDDGFLDFDGTTFTSESRSELTGWFGRQVVSGDER